MNRTAKFGKRDQILHAAAHVFSRKSFYQVKIQEVADAAGVGKGTIYEYFSSKEELFSQLIKEGIAYYNERISLELMNGRDLWQQLEMLLEANINFVWENQEIARIILSTDHPFHEVLSRMMLQLRDRSLQELEQAFNRAIETGEIERMDSRLAARLFRGAMIEVFTTMVLFEGEKPSKTDIKGALALFRRGLEKP